jgi:hypothetical protein
MGCGFFLDGRTMKKNLEEDFLQDGLTLHVWPGLGLGCIVVFRCLAFIKILKIGTW